MPPPPDAAAASACRNRHARPPLTRNRPSRPTAFLLAALPVSFTHRDPIPRAHPRRRRSHPLGRPRVCAPATTASSSLSNADADATAPPAQQAATAARARWAAGGELRAFARALRLTLAVSLALCFVDVLLGLAALWAGTAQAVAELFGGGVGLRATGRLVRAAVAAGRRAAWELWRSVRRETREKFLED